MVAEAEIGEQARKFVESDLGKVIIGMARQDAEKALAKLEDVDPNKPLEIAAHQSEIKVARKFEQYLSELITRGDNALEIFRHESQN